MIGLVNVQQTRNLVPRLVFHVSHQRDLSVNSLESYLEESTNHLRASAPRASLEIVNFIRELAEGRIEFSTNSGFRSLAFPMTGR